MCCCHEENHQQKIKIAISIIIFVGALAANFSGLTKFTIFFAAYMISGYDVIFRAIKNIVKGKVFDEKFLMGIATTSAFAIGEYPEAVMVMILYQIGEMLQDSAVEKSRHSISELMNIRPDYANVEINGKPVKKNPQEIKIGDIIKVKTGEKIPLDGTIIDGEASVDTAALTGESAPKNLKTGDIALSGCINLNGVLTIRVEKEFGESTVSKILKLVEQAGSKKAKAENFITKFARYYTPAVVLGALLLTVLPVLLTGAQFTVWFQRALTLLVISCPCALVISIPLAFFAGIGGASNKGILIKGACYIDTLSKPDTIVFDKTGTLTKAIFKVTTIQPQNGISKEKLLELAAFCENYSNHPVANSLKDAYGKSIDTSQIKNIEEIAGRGIKTVINGDEVLAGNNRLMEMFKINYTETNKAGTIVYMAKNREYSGYIIISDEIKKDSKFTISALKRKGIKTVMLTGDNSQSAGMFAQDTGITKFYSELLPEQKVEKLEDIIEHKDKDKSVIFVGDGINDAPVLTRADAGIAMGALGSDAAIEAADIVIMDDKPSKILRAILIAQKTMIIVKQNIIFALGIKALFLILGGFGIVTMWGAVFADTGVALIAILNSLRAVKT